MAYVIDRKTKEIGTMHTPEALQRVAEFVVYDHRQIPADVVSSPPQYRVLDMDNGKEIVRVATEAERAQIDREIAIAQLPERKAQKIAELDAAREAAERTGVTVGNVTLASSEYDQRRLATFLVGINEAISLGLYSTETEVAVTDASDRDVPMTVSQFKLLAVAYMAGCQRQRAEHRAKRAAIQNAATPEELEAI